MRLREPAIDEEPVPEIVALPLTKRFPPIDAYDPTSKAAVVEA